MVVTAATRDRPLCLFSGLQLGMLTPVAPKVAGPLITTSGHSRNSIPNGMAVGDARGWSVVGVVPCFALNIRHLHNSSCAILPLCIPSNQHY
jgi:hypothetical protein